MINSNELLNKSTTASQKADRRKNRKTKCKNMTSVVIKNTWQKILQTQKEQQNFN